MTAPVATTEDEIVITAAPLRTSLGASRAEVVRRAIAGECALERSRALEGFPGGADDRTFACADGPRGADRAEELLARTIADALRECGLSGDALSSRRVRLVVGTTLNGMRHLGESLRLADPREAAYLSAARVTAIACERNGLPGAGITVSTACASGITAIGLACDLLRAGDADLVLAGGYDPVSEFSHAGFGALRLLASGPPRPFAHDREGMRTAEGYALLVLERAHDATRRGARILARVGAVAERSDGFHLTQPHPLGDGAAAAALEAIELAGTPDLLVAHATGTEANDAAEYRAYERVFGERLATLPIAAPKSFLGHTLGAAGAVDAVLCIAMAESGSTVPMLDRESAVDRAAFPALAPNGESKPTTLRRTMNLAIGFGGSNAALLLEHGALAATPRAASAGVAGLPRSNGTASSFAGAAQHANGHPAPARRGEDIEVTGWSAIIPGATLVGDALAALPELVAGDVPDEQIAAHMDARAARRIAPVSRLVRAAVRLAIDDAALGAEALAESQAFCATQHGAISYSLGAYRDVIDGGLGAGNPLLFAESVPNVPGAQCALAFGLRGAALSVIGSRVGVAEALLLARARMRAGGVSRVILVAAEESDPYLERSIAAWHRRTGGGREVAAGAVVLILETESARRARGGRARARLGAIAWEPPSSHRVPDLLAAGASARSALHGPLDLPGRPGLVGRLERRVAGDRCGETLGAEFHAAGLLLLAVRRAARGERAAAIALDPFGAWGGFELLPCEATS